MKYRYWVWFLLFSLTLIAYANGLTSDFVGDDIGRITSKEMYYREGLFSVFHNVLPDRPLLTLTLWLNFLVAGMNPFSFKLVNVLLHAGCVIGVFELLLYVFKASANRISLCFFAAAIFAVHPINNQAVMSVVQRGISLSVLLSIVSFFLLLEYLKRGRNRWWLASAVLFLLALLAKPNVIMFPFIFIMLLMFLERKSFKESLLLCLPHFLVFAVPALFYFYLRVNSQANAIPAFNYFLVETKVVFFYFSKYFAPLGLQFLYPINNQPELLQNFYETGYLAAHLALVGLAVWALKKKRLEGLLVLCGYLSFLPESGFFSILHVAFDHRNYIPLIFFSGAFVLVTGQLLRLIKACRAVPFLLAPAVLVLTGLNLNYTEMTRTYDKWVFYNLAKNPQNKSFYTYQLAQSVDAGNRDRAVQVTLAIGSSADTDPEVKWLNSFLDFDGLPLAGQKKFVGESLAFATANQVSVHYFYFYEDFLLKKLPALYDHKLATLAHNSFYFAYLSYWQKYLTAPEMGGRIQQNLSEALNLTAGGKTDLEKVISLRSRLALHFFFYEFPEINLNEIAVQLKGEFAQFPESPVLLNWIESGVSR